MNSHWAMIAGWLSCFYGGWRLCQIFTDIQEKRRLPYSWRCPEHECNYRVKAEHMETLDECASAHEKSHNGV